MKYEICFLSGDTLIVTQEEYESIKDKLFPFRFVSVGDNLINTMAIEDIKPYYVDN